MTYTEVSLLRAVRARSGRGELQQLQFKDNRVRLLSISRDGTTLYLHRLFRTAPEDVVAAIADFLGAERGSIEATGAAARIRGWVAEWAGESGAESAGEWAGEWAGNSSGESTARSGATPTIPHRAPRPGRCCGTPAQRRFLSDLYRDFNQVHCAGLLPADLPLRFSSRMRRRLGHFRFHLTETGERAVVEIALNIDLMTAGSEHQLRDTLLHEMAHAAAWLFHGERGHGPQWRRIARQYGCVPRACAEASVALRAPGESPTTRVPPRELVWRAAGIGLG